MSNAGDPTSFSMDFAIQAKNNVVFSFGIGSDLHPIIIGFDEDNEPFGFAQMRRPSLTMTEGLQRIAEVGTLMRSGWHCNSLAVIAEGYASTRGISEELDMTKTFAQRFADGDKRVTECLTVAWASEYGECEVSVVPYTIGLGRKILWDLDGGILLKDGRGYGKYPELLLAIAEEVEKIPYPQSVPFELCLLSIANEIEELGFYVECDAIGTNMDWINNDDK